MKKIVIDSCVFVAAALKKDSQHQVAVKLLNKFKSENKWVNPLIVSEVATILLLKTKQTQFVSTMLDDLFFSNSAFIKIEKLTKKLWLDSYDIFCHQNSHKLSFADCSLLAQAKVDQQEVEILTLDEDLLKELN